jgi:tetratricopeptide (TPR) repeat protein
VLNNPSLQNELTFLLGQLENARLVHRLADLDPAYLFNHTLGQESAYESLLVKTRRLLHRRVAEAYEALYPDRTDDVASVLAYHFGEAGEPAKTLEYARRAAQAAARVYAYTEAIVQYSSALKAAAELKLSSADLRHARGQAYEFLGNFDHALSDFEAMLADARANRNSSNEWLALMDLGYLWSARDYARVGDLFRQALELTGEIGDPKRRAETLNRLGNWLVNIGQIQEGQASHQQALRVFQEQRDRQAEAETLDLLALTYSMQGDFLSGTEYLDRAILVFRESNNQASLVSSLSGRTALANSSGTEMAVGSRRGWVEYERDVTEALERSRELGWPAAQAFALFASAQTLPGFGRLGQALEKAHEALKIARDIQHDQWVAASELALGEIYLYLLNPARAIEQLEPGLELSQKLGSAIWTADAATRLTRAFMMQGNLGEAKQMLDRHLPRTRPPQNLPDRQLIWARGLLALKEHRAAEALEISRELIDSTPGAPSAPPIPALLKLKGEALVQLKQYNQGIQGLRAAREASETENQALLWEIDLALGKAYLETDQSLAAAEEFSSARRQLESLAATVTEDELRDHMLESALSRFAI